MEISSTGIVSDLFADEVEEAVDAATSDYAEIDNSMEGRRMRRSLSEQKGFNLG